MPANPVIPVMPIIPAKTGTPVESSSGFRFREDGMGLELTGIAG
ncbi:MAG: hypothetical protein AB8B64_25725 [Granulosicoccus sp.]